MKKFLASVMTGVLAFGSVCALSACDNRRPIGVQAGTTGQYFVDGDDDWGFDGISGYKSKGYANGGLAVTDMKNGNVDYVIIDQAPATELKKAISGIKVIDIPLTVEEYAFGVDKENDALLQSVNTILASAEFATKFDSIVAAYATGEGISPVASATYDAAKQETQLVVATNAAFAPFEYMEGNLFAGIDMEIAKYIADELDMELVIRNMDFTAVVTSVGKNGVDMAMAGLTVNETRKQSVNFTTSYYNAAQVLITSADDTSFDNCTTAEEIIAKLVELAK